MAPVNVLFITYRSDVGGGPQVLADLVAALRQHRPSWKLSIASPRQPPWGERFEAAADAFLALKPGAMAFPCNLLAIMRFIRTHHVSIIHSHGRGAGIYARLAGWLTRCSVVHSFHGIHRDPSWTGRLKLTIDRLLAPLATSTICSSAGEYEAALSLGLATKDKTELIFNAVYVDLLRSELAEIDRIEARKVFGIRDDAIVFGTLARLDYQKGVDLMLPAFARLLKEHEGRRLHLLIAGNGADYASLESYATGLGIQESVSFLGEISHVQAFLRALDVYLSFSRWEGMPLSVLAAMAAGLPCLLSHCPGHDSLIHHGHNGLVHDTSDPQSFVTAAMSIIDDPAAAATMGERACAWVRTHNAPDTWIDRTTAVLERNLEPRRDPSGP